ncbi:MAG: penicillin-binding protein 2 [Flavobacteriales bacterium]|nr:penicillin-binding protein 2 [Flavobacteriales bacterium]|tara:strand:- start:1608 stop:3434 length:1827 start_codon:yes stop_codon:yes gene_type:complete
MRKYDFYTHRKYSVIILVCVAFLFIIIKLFSIQILNQSYKLSAQNNVIRKIIKYPERGWIYDRNNELLVSNQIAHDIMIVPYQVSSQIDTLLFCDIFKISIEDFEKKIKSAKKYSYYKPSIFLKGIDKQQFADIQENLHFFKGFYPQPKYIREYTTRFGGNIFGYISQITPKLLKENGEYNREDLIGVTGVEKIYEKILKGEKGVERRIVDVFGKQQGAFEDGSYDTLSKPGGDITLTIDMELQKYAEKIMQEKRGSIVAIEPNSGEILCLVSSPSYDPKMFIGNNRGSNFRKLYLDPGKPLYDRSITASYPPGSIFKLINALIGLQEKTLTAGTLFQCNDGWDYKSILHIGCHKHKSPLNLRQAIAQSCNAYFCSTFDDIISKYKSSSDGLENWHQHVESFGLNNSFDNNFYIKKSGFIPNAKYYDDIYGKKRWGASTCISLGIGQDALLMTPLQMANIASIIANRGYYKTPHIIKLINHSTDSVDIRFSKKIYCSIDSIYFSPVIYGMQTAVDGKYGTAKSGELSNVTICGKTGTAQNPHGEDHSIFIAFAPKINPVIAIAVYVENGGWGSETATPIGSLCIEKYINNEVERKELENKIKNKNVNY